MCIRSLRCAALCGVLLATQGLRAQAQREFRVAAPEGQLSLLNLSREVLNQYGFAGEHLDFPDLRIDLRGLRGALLLMGIDKATGKAVRLRRSGDGGSLVVRVDQLRVRDARRRVKRRVGRALGLLVGRDLLARHYALEVPTGIGRDETWLLCIHGVDSSPKVFADLRDYLAGRPRPVRSGTFAFANDEAIDRIAAALASRLQAEARAFPRRKVVILAHSMGGLVARAVIEDPALDPGNVRSLIGLGVPNQGSRLARFRIGADLKQMFEQGSTGPRLLAPLLDGMGEATWDLSPGSPILRSLAAGKRNPAVHYHAILGNRGVFQPAEWNRLRRRLLGNARRIRQAAVVTDRLDRWLADLDEVVDGAGDGVVAVSRGQLEGVEAVVMPVSHLGMLRAAPAGETQPVFAQVAAWVQAEAGKSGR